MKNIIERWKNASLLTKVGSIIFLPFATAIFIAMSPVIFIMWAISSFDEIVDGREDIGW